MILITVFAFQFDDSHSIDSAIKGNDRIGG